MIRVLVLGLTLIASAFAAHAADKGGPSAWVHIVEPPAAKAFSWTGFYAGVHAGYLDADTEGDISNGEDSLSFTVPDLNGGVLGGHVGFNYQMGNLVFGIEGTLAAVGAESNALIIADVEIDKTATLVGRIAYAFDRTMIYGKAGYAHAFVKARDSSNILRFENSGFSLNRSEDLSGFAIGGGLETALTDNIILRVDYTHMKLDGDTLENAVFEDADLKFDSRIDQIVVGVSFKF